MFRYSFGGDEFLYVEVGSDGMSLESFFQALAICNLLKEAKIRGITEICPANASYMIRFNPDILHYKEALNILQNMEKEVNNENSLLETRIIEIPVLYDDPWTNETLMRFRDNHQVRVEGSAFNPNTTDLEYGATINGYKNKQDFIKAHHENPWFVSMIGFVAGLPWLYQLVDRDRQIEMPKYLKARIDTPKLTIGHGGCFGCIYAVRGGGGYQMLGITPAPIWDPLATLDYFNGSMVFLRPGDIIKFNPISEDEYNTALMQVDNVSFTLNIKPATFSLKEWQENPLQYNKKLLEVLHG